MPVYDLVPDFIPLLGYLDDVILVPLGIALAVRLIPAALWEEHRIAAAHATERPASRIAAAVIIGIWMSVGLAMLYWMIGLLVRSS